MARYNVIDYTDRDGKRCMTVVTREQYDRMTKSEKRKMPLKPETVRVTACTKLDNIVSELKSYAKTNGYDVYLGNDTLYSDDDGEDVIIVADKTGSFYAVCLGPYGEPEVSFYDGCMSGNDPLPQDGGIPIEDVLPPTCN